MSTATARAVAVRGPELTIRGLVLGVLITLVFTAANVYLGLKVGLTFASSIPAAVISMAVLRALFPKTSTIYENNIVQTVASAAGTLSSIIFVLPGLVMIGWWTGFPFWQSFGICVVGGILGVMYTVPLRRALVTNSDLPYPEGVAAAEVLRVGAGAVAPGGAAVAPSAAAVAENKAGLIAVLWGSAASALYYVFTQVVRLTDEVGVFGRFGSSATGAGLQLSLALVGAGYLVGLSVGVAMLAGLFIAWGIATPVLTALHPAAGDAEAFARGIWRHNVRFIGAGAIGISAIWTLGKLARPVWNGVASALAASRRRASDGGDTLPITERDIPIGVVALICVACLVPLAALLAAFLAPTGLGAMSAALVTGAIVYIVVAGFLVAAACGYMAGLIGSSNSPVSGLAILTVLGASVLLVAMARSADPASAQALVAYALFVTAVVLCVATIANDNLQDLKTGQLVEATPWKQQAALVVGVFAGAVVIPPILDLLNHAYGFPGTPHVAGGPTAVAAQPLAAPQATLISALAKGVIQGQLDWGLLGIGVLAGIVIIIVDEALGLRRRLRLPPLAVGIGIYLPPGTTLAVVVGALIGAGFDRWVLGRPNPDVAKRLGVLMASGLIVGESLCGVLIAGVIVFSGKDAPLALLGTVTPVAEALGVIVFIAVTLALYRWVGNAARRAG